MIRAELTAAAMRYIVKEVRGIACGAGMFQCWDTLAGAGGRYRYFRDEAESEARRLNAIDRQDIEERAESQAIANSFDL